MKEIFVFDATPLIYLGKERILEKVKTLSGRNIIPSSVFTEVVTIGKEFGNTDAWYVESLVKNKLFEIMDTKQSIAALSGNKNLTQADIDVLSIAKSLKARAILDDNEARSVAEIEGISKGGSIYLLFRLLATRLITKKECRMIVDSMLQNGWRCSTEMYAFVLKKLE